jgi:hypothetical protein
VPNHFVYIPVVGVSPNEKMSDAAFPSDFLFQSLKVLRGYARRTQKQNLYANTTFLPNGQLQLELPANALIDLDSLCIHARIAYTAKDVAQGNPGRYQCWPPTVGAFIQNATVLINGEAFQVTDYIGDLQVVLTDFSYGDAVQKRMALQQLGGESHYRMTRYGPAPAAGGPQPVISDDGARDIILTCADIPGFLSSIQPRVFNTALVGPVQINLVLKGPEILGQASGNGFVYVVKGESDGAIVQNPAVPAVPGPPPVAAVPASTFIPGVVPSNSDTKDGAYDVAPGWQAAPAGEDSGYYTWTNVVATMDVLSMPPEFTQLNNMVLASGNTFTCPFHQWNVFVNAMGGSFGRTMRFSIATQCLDMVLSWFNPFQRIQDRNLNNITRRSKQWVRVMPATWQMQIGGTLYPSFPVDRQYSWPIFLSSIGKLHDASHEFHGSLNSMFRWNNLFGVMLYRLNVLDHGGREFYSGLNTVNSAIQCTITTTPLTAGTQFPITAPFGYAGDAWGTDASIPAGSGTQFVAVKTTKILSLGANKSSSQMQ